MLSAISLERLSQVHPELSKRIQTMAQMLDLEDFPFQVTQGLRSWSQQNALFLQVPKVTNTPGGYSWHNFGMAVDVVPDDISKQGFQPDWNTSHPSWIRLVAVGESLGLVSGSTWRSFPDYPHFQLTGKWPANPTDEVRQLFKDGGLPAVWEQSGIG